MAALSWQLPAERQCARCAAWDDARPRQSVWPVRAAGMLHPAIGMMDEARQRAAAVSSHVYTPTRVSAVAKESLMVQRHTGGKRSKIPATYSQPSAVLI